MSGTPAKRERTEQARLNGELTAAAPAHVADAAPEPAPKKRGASPERMRELVAIRQAKIAAGDLSARGGRARTRRTRREAEEEALQRMVPRALKVLEEQLDDPDERIRQSAAVKVLEWGKGKPSLAVKIDGEQTHTIRYETVVALPEIIEELPSAEAVMDEIEPADWVPLEAGDDDDAA